jgi:hypothetical protein
MRVLFASLASVGHTYPLIPLAIAARNAGHDVHFAVGEEVHPVLKANGLNPFRPADAFYEIYAEDLAPSWTACVPTSSSTNGVSPAPPPPPAPPVSPASGTGSAACTPTASVSNDPPAAPTSTSAHRRCRTRTGTNPASRCGPSRSLNPVRCSAVP